MTLTVSNSALAQTYKRHPIGFSRGEGVWLYDESGKKYLDLLSGIGVNALGHQHPVILQAMMTAAQAPMHVSNLYQTPVGEKLAQSLCARSFADAVFLCNSGTEAVEGAIKFARKVKPGGPIVAFRGSFHGRSLGALSVTWNPKYREPFEPLIPGVQWADFNDMNTVISNETTAVIVEPIQGEGGVNPATPEFLQMLRQRCHDTGAVLIFDEVQCGMGRTGTLWAHEQSGVTPDIMTLAKPLGGGLPIGAILMSRAVADSLAYGDHGTTFGGGPFITAVAQAVFDTVSTPSFIEHVQQVGQLLHQGLSSLPVTVRGCGLMWGLQLPDTIPVESVIAAGHDAGVLLGQSAGNTVRLLPPLILDASHVALAVDLLRKVLT